MQFTLSLLSTLTALASASHPGTGNIWSGDNVSAGCTNGQCSYSFTFSGHSTKDLPEFEAHCSGHTGIFDAVLRPCTLVPGKGHTSSAVVEASAYLALTPPSKEDPDGKAQAVLRLDFNDANPFVDQWQGTKDGSYTEFAQAGYSFKVITGPNTGA
ncbi:unnamed protein product [Zymoseptoria tritici ST99CH_3D7]|uniref:Uncharacterized protein n=3 Tax=Zymoseptoria tritici TaxID=1047171 RepID=F9XJ06_ZYMTI|nr:uncharacterized protein MYCGRDRAFT_95537 [Zymoseptoria tritici IPO323]EGP84270.1 hypothetical protein MYCGRDRAFT_95537 [Zymoseptoria tritici IPO323]SMQ53827.1 unnamed protein product [Zymoseptoria tritici ST99CH_3D7]SMR58268.1 unnamed protein product [Zymoseptoria tritici ST99CH_1E4]